MKQAGDEIAGLIHQAAEKVSEEVGQAIGMQHQELMRHFELGAEPLRDHCRNHLAYLAEAIRADQRTVYTDYVEWETAVLLRRRLPIPVVRGNMLQIRDTAVRHLPQRVRSVVSGYFAAAIRLVDDELVGSPSASGGTRELNPLAKEYLNELLSGDRQSARTLILHALEKGLDVRRAYLEVLQPVQREVGRLWEIDAITVAQEHYCTAVTQLIISQLYPEIMAGPRNGLVMVASCVGRELHELGLRMVADFFELSGWDTRFFGANMPVDQIVVALADVNADVLAVSTTMLAHIESVRTLIAKARKVCHPDLKVLVGGLPFNRLSDLWKSVGADATAHDAQEAVEVAERMLSRG